MFIAEVMPPAWYMRSYHVQRKEICSETQFSNKDTASEKAWNFWCPHDLLYVRSKGINLQGKVDAMVSFVIQISAAMPNQ